MPRRLFALAVLMSVSAVGCGDGNLAPVSGRVTMDDKPLAGATVSFIPDSDPKKKAPPVAIGKTDADGRFTLTIPSDRGDRKGAIVGKCKVSITLIEEVEPGQQKEPPRGKAKDKDAGHAESSSSVNHIPERYNSKTELTFEVPAKGTADANFDLKSKEAPAPTLPKGPANPNTKIGLPKSKGL
jgi:hypothetical protein